MILVTDDDPKIKASLEIAFPEYRFLGASNGAEALEILARPHEIDLVFLDFKMPGEDGAQVLEKIKKIDPNLPVILLTGFGSKDTVLKALRARADDFLDKPFDIEETRQKIKSLIETGIRHQADKAAEGVIGRVIRYLEKNYQKDVTLESAAEFACLSPKYLSRLFKESTGSGFAEFRVELRLKKAKMLLKDSDKTIGDIAREIGYENSESFSKIFRKFENCTPSEYRERQ